MVRIFTATNWDCRFALTFLIAAHLISACGLVLDNEARLDRAQQAYADSEFRAVIIDAKNVLLEEPDNARARVLLGRASIEMGDAVSAEKELIRALELGADEGEVAVDLGRALLALRQYDRVLDEVSADSTETEEDLHQIYQLHGNALLGLNRPVEARSFFSRIIESGDTNVEPLLGVVSSYVGEQNYMQARATLDQVLSTHGDFVSPWLVSGQLYFQMRNAESAEKHFDRALGLAVSQGDKAAEVKALTGLGDALLAQNKSDTARVMTERLMNLSPNAPSSMHLSARVAYIDRDWPEAERLLQEVLRRIPDYRPAQLLLGAVHLQNGNLEQAEMYLSVVVSAVPGNADARNLLAQVRLRQKDISAAQALLQPILEGSAPNAGTLALAAQASLDLGNFDRAAEYLRQAAETIPDNPEAKLDLAALYLMANRFGEAQSILDSIELGENGADHFRGDMLAVMSLVQAGNIPAAVELAKTLTEKWPQNARVLALIGSVEMHNGDPTSARKRFEDATNVAPNDIVPKRFLAMVEETEGDYTEAAVQLREIIDIEPNDMNAIVGLARLSSRADDPKGMRHWLERAIAADPRRLDLRKTLGQLLLSLRDFEAARNLAEDTISVANDNADAHRLSGHALLNLKELSAAQDAFKKAILLDPNEPEYRIALARAQIASGDNESAQKTVLAAYEFDPENVPIAVLFASIKTNSGDMDGAMKIAEDLVRAHPGESAPLSLQAEVLVRSGNLSAAASKYEQTLAIDNAPRFAARAYEVRKAAGLPDADLPLMRHLEEFPLNTDIRTFLAQAYQVDGKNQSAIDQYERVLQTAPDSFVALNNLAWSYFIVEDPRAEAIARKAYEMEPENGFVIDTLGWIMVQQGDLEGGVDFLRKAAGLSNENRDIQFHLASGLAKTGQKEEARRILEVILRDEQNFSGRAAAEQLLIDL